MRDKARCASGPARSMNGYDARRIAHDRLDAERPADFAEYGSLRDYGRMMASGGNGAIGGEVAVEA